ncbi:MAG TPA: SDR family NAD(P)-dependent oxidoreductase [Longimicrobiaceae bacterium]|nr:SDR family NAD(P)-dependent oxidoreductase [Longimicrobiaceae bacterium]
MDAGVDLGLRGRRALVTGGSRGVGCAVALLLARAGADVGIGYRSRAAEADEVVERLRASGVRGWAQAADLSTPEGVDGLFARARREFDGLDLFVANAGIWPPDAVPLSEMSDEQWRRTLDVNLTSVFLSLRRAAGLLSDGARVVLISSTAGQRGEPFHGDYAASKGALIALTKSVAVELAPRGITVNCVAPGWVDTEMVARPFADGGRERYARQIPLGRVASAEDVAGPVLFLCSALARHVTGEVLNVNGGSVLCG